MCRRFDPGPRHSPQRAAFFTRAATFASAAGVISFSAYEVGHSSPSSRLALSLKPSVAYLDLNFAASWKNRTALPSLAYAGIPYQVVDARAGAFALTMACSRFAMPRSGSFIAAIFASSAVSPSRPAAAAFWSAMVSFIAAFSAAVSPTPFADLRVLSFALFFAAMSGRHFLADLRRLEDPDAVTEWIS